MTTRLRRIGLIAALGLVLSPTAGGAQQGHLEKALGWTTAPVSNAVLDARIRAAAVEYRRFAPIPRIGVYDVAYPLDSAEAVALHGFAVLLVTVLVQDSAEVPVTRVYLRAAKRDADATLVASLASRVSAADTAVRATFGAYRVDALYLVPLAAAVEGGDLLADFAVSRREFRLGAIGVDLPMAVRNVGAVGGTGQEPPRARVEQFVRREFPSIAELLFESP